MEFMEEATTVHALYRHYLADVYALARRRKGFVYIRTYLKDDREADIIDTKCNCTVLLLLQPNCGKPPISKSFFQRTVPEDTLAYFCFLPGEDYLVYRKSSTFYIILPLNKRLETPAHGVWPYQTGHRLVDVFYFGMYMEQYLGSIGENESNVSQDNSKKNLVTEESSLDKFEAACGIDLRKIYSHRMLFVTGDNTRVEFFQMS